jgi:hypothetical protein
MMSTVQSIGLWSTIYTHTHAHLCLSEYISLLLLTAWYLLNHCLILLEVTGPYLIYFIDIFSCVLLYIVSFISYSFSLRILHLFPHFQPKSLTQVARGKKSFSERENWLCKKKMCVRMLIFLLRLLCERVRGCFTNVYW